MADERLTLEFDVAGIDKITGLYRMASAAVGGMGTPGGLLSIANVVAQAGALSAASIGVASAIGVTAGALAGFAAAVRHATETITSFSGLQSRLGASAGSTGLAQMIGSALGVGDIGGLAHQLRLARSTGIGAMAGGKHGLGFLPPFEIGEAVDESQGLFKLLRDIRSYHEQGRDQEMLADLRNLGMERLAGARFIAPEILQQLERENTLRKQLFSEQNQAAALMLNVEMTRLNAAFGDLSTAIGAHLLPAVTTVIHAAASGTRFAAQGAGFALDTLIGGIPMVGPLLQGAIAALSLPRAGQNAQVAAQKETTRAIERLQDVIVGTAGGGPRLQGAIPRAFRGGGISAADALVQASLRLGSYSVAM